MRTIAVSDGGGAAIRRPNSATASPRRPVALPTAGGTNSSFCAKIAIHIEDVVAIFVLGLKTH